METLVGLHTYKRLRGHVQRGGIGLLMLGAQKILRRSAVLLAWDNSPVPGQCPARNGGDVAGWHGTTRGPCRGRLARHEPSATTRASGARSQRGTHRRPSDVLFFRLTSSRAVHHGKRTAAVDRGGYLFGLGTRGRTKAAPSENIPTHGSNSGGWYACSTGWGANQPR